MELPVDTDKTGDLPAFPPMHVSHAPASCRALWAPAKKRKKKKKVQKQKGVRWRFPHHRPITRSPFGDGCCRGAEVSE